MNVMVILLLFEINLIMHNIFFSSQIGCYFTIYNFVLLLYLTASFLLSLPTLFPSIFLLLPLIMPFFHTHYAKHTPLHPLTHNYHLFFSLSLYLSIYLSSYTFAFLPSPLHTHSPCLPSSFTPSSGEYSSILDEDGTGTGRNVLRLPLSRADLGSTLTCEAVNEAMAYPYSAFVNVDVNGK